MVTPVLPWGSQSPTPTDTSTTANTGLLGSGSTVTPPTTSAAPTYASTAANAPTATNDPFGTAPNSQSNAISQPVGVSGDPNATPAQATPAITDVAQATPTNWNVNPNQTVQGQIQNVIASDSPLMQLAKTNANQEMASRGLLNSSMAVGAGQDAVYKAALPIAQQDASTNAASGQFNANAANQASTFNAGEVNKASAINVDAATKAQLDQIDNNYKSLMETSATASQLQANVYKNINDIAMSNTMDQTAKTAAINNQLAMLSSGLAVQGKIGNLDLNSILDFSGVSTVPGTTPAPADTSGDSANAKKQAMIKAATNTAVMGVLGGSMLAPLGLGNAGQIASDFVSNTFSSFGF